MLFTVEKVTPQKGSFSTLNTILSKVSFKVMKDFFSNENVLPVLTGDVVTENGVYMVTPFCENHQESNFISQLTVLHQTFYSIKNRIQILQLDLLDLERVIKTFETLGVKNG